MIGLAIALIVAGPASSSAPAHKATSLKDARKAVRRDKATSEGRAWERKQAPWLGPAITPTMERCLQEAPKGKKGDFTVHLRLSSSGTVSESLVAPETEYTKCFRDGVSRLTYPEVPREGFWFEIEMVSGPPPR